jgi:hypothetical protein
VSRRATGPALRRVRLHEQAERQATASTLVVGLRLRMGPRAVSQAAGSLGRGLGVGRRPDRDPRPLALLRLPVCVVMTRLARWSGSGDSSWAARIVATTCLQSVTIGQVQSLVHSTHWAASTAAGSCGHVSLTVTS